MFPENVDEHRVAETTNPLVAHITIKGEIFFRDNQRCWFPVICGPVSVPNVGSESLLK
jgi:hypothetical protein